MTAVLATTQPLPLSVFTEAQRDLIKRTVATDATNDELAMFLHVAAKSGLDPLQKQIWFVKRSGRVTIQAGIDGLQARAAREADYEGMLYGVVCEKDAFSFDATTGVVKEHTYNPFANRGPTLGAWCIVRRKGLLPFTAMVRFSEYVQAQSPLWQSKPAVMIEKVARSTALRRAYPEQFGGIYEPTEMGDKGHAPASEPEAEAQPIPSRAAEAKRLEGTPAVTVDAPKKANPKAIALWSRLVTDCGEDKKMALEKFDAASKKFWGTTVPPTSEWTDDATAEVERILFDIRF
jgi:phage recombination protein Bet